MPRVSVVIPTYNRAAVIGRTVGSVLRQRFENFEAIIVDDASTDETERIVRSFDDPRIKYLSHETNRGGSAARNTGIKAAEGEYIAFLDSDDEWHPAKLERQLNYLETRSEEWVAAYCDYRIARHGPTARVRKILDRVVPGSPRTTKPEGGAELIPRVLATEFALGGASTLLVKRSTIDRLGGFDERFRRHQDWEFLIRLLRLGRLAYINETLVRKHQERVPSTESVRAGKEQLFETFAEDIHDAERAGYNVAEMHRFKLATYAYLNGEFLAGSRYLVGADVNLRVVVWAVCRGLPAWLSRLRRLVSSS